MTVRAFGKCQLQIAKFISDIKNLQRAVRKWSPCLLYYFDFTVSAANTRSAQTVFTNRARNRHL